MVERGVGQFFCDLVRSVARLGTQRWYIWWATLIGLVRNVAIVPDSPPHLDSLIEQC